MGRVFDLSENVKFKPSGMFKGVLGAPLSIDLSANVMLYDKLEFGVSSRFTESFSAMFNIRVNRKLRFGYAYDYIYNNLGSFSSGSHEVFLLFNLSNRSNGSRSSLRPRFY